MKNNKYIWLRKLTAVMLSIFILLQATLPTIVAVDGINSDDVTVSEVLEEESFADETSEQGDELADLENILESEVIEDEPAPTLITFTVRLIWDDGNDVDGLRPTSIAAHLLENHNGTGNVATLSAANHWTYTWYELPDDRHYSVEDLQLPSGYVAYVNPIDATHVVITNQYTPKPVEESVSSEKTEVESEDETPAVESADETTQEESKNETEKAEEGDETKKEDDEKEKDKDNIESTEDETVEDKEISPLSITDPEEEPAVTYNFYVAETLYQTQIILDGESLVVPEVPTGLGNFLGWFVSENGTDVKLSFGSAITITEASPETVDVHAKFDNAHYVEFIQAGSIIATKLVPDGEQVTADGVPVIEDIEDGKIFSHWSTSLDGPAFDFAQAITADLTLYAVADNRFKVEFDTNGGTSQLPIFVAEGEYLNLSALSVEKEGYQFSHWVLPDGTPYTGATPVTSNLQLKAVWNAINQTYTVIYWHENANDNGYTFKEAVEKQGLTGENATFDQKNYPHFTYSHADQGVKIKGDSSTQINVYYSRETYRLIFRRNRWWNSWTTYVDIQVKHGASIQSYWDDASLQAGSGYNWRDGDKNVQIEAPIMPQENLTLDAVESGNQLVTVNFVETGVFETFKTVQFYTNRGSTFIGGREVTGFTWQYVTSPGQETDTFSPQDYTVRTYYDRNNYDIQFVTNNPHDTPTIDFLTIPYESDLTEINPEGYVIDDTTIIVNGVTYVFKGWFNNEALGGEPYNFAGTKMPAHNMVMYAKWEPRNFTVINHFGDGESSKAITVVPGEQVNEADLEKIDNDHEFAGWYWYVDDRYVTFDLNMPINQDGIEIHPEWKDNEVNILYDANGGENPPIDGKNYKVGAEATTKTKETMAKGNQQFIGWNTKADGSGTSYNPREDIELTASLMQNGTITLYAQWSELDETAITYHSNNPTGEGSSEEVTLANLQMNSLVSVLAAGALNLNFAYEGYTFMGWNTAADGSGTAYAEGAVVRLNNKEPSENILYAQWIKNIDVTVNKVWQDANNQDGKRAGSISVQLLANGSPRGNVVPLSAAGNWSYTWRNLPARDRRGNITYSVQEVSVPEGYHSTVGQINKGVITVTNTYTPEKTTINGRKTWNDADDQDGLRPTSITVNLLANGTQVASENVTASDNWAYEFTNLPKYAGGKLITYTLEEVAVPGYTSVIDGYNITNTHTPATTSVSGSKTWDDANNQDNKRPEEIMVHLHADGELVDSKKVSGTGNVWDYSFTNLPKFKDGVLITYTVTETSVDGYNLTSPAGDPFLVNQRTPDQTSVTVTKAWEDANDQDGKRPDSVSVQLLADGEASGEAAILDKGNNWSHTWTDLPANSAGKKIIYTVVEPEVPADYESTVTGDEGNFIITNRYTPETRSVSGSKTWDDANNQDGKRPGTIVINLLAEGEIITSKDVTGTGNIWSYSFDNLPVYQAGKRINYRVSEKVVDGYQLISPVGDPLLINRRTPDVRDITVSKTWNDNDDQDGLRPNNVSVQLLADGKASGEAVTLDKANGWSHTWTGLAVNSAGETINYTVAEVEVPKGYQSSIDGFAITNSHTPEKITIVGAKTWNDGDDQDGIRPTEITVNLQVGEQIIATENVSADENGSWNYQFTELDKFADGEEITYTISEEAIEGYVASVDGYNITNTHVPAERSISVHKVWNDADNQDGIRPDNVTVQLLADDTEVGEPEMLMATNDWSHTWSNLPKNANGEEITYHVAEVEVPTGYTSAITSNGDNFTVTNSYTPQTIVISGEKFWQDGDDQDGLRPESITVNLLAGEVQVQSQLVTATDHWQYEFNNLPKYAAGEEIHYTIEEVEVEGYTAQVNGYNITNSHTPAQTSVTVNKTWDDADDQDGKRPESITIRLLADGTEVANEEVAPDVAGEWQHTFAGLDKFADGEEIVYTITEDEVAGYTTTIDGFTVTNKHLPETISISGNKQWDDANDQDGKRPTSITVSVFAEGVEVGKQEVTPDKEDNWSYLFSDLPKYADGEEITYTVTEDAVADYTIEIDGFDIRNTHIPATTRISGKKTWLDNDDQDGVRPESITVNLVASIGEGQSIPVTAETNWQYEFTDLPVYADGVIIDYSITEDAVPGYSTEYDGNDIVNSRTPDTRSVTVTKVWNDAGDQDGLRPDSVSVQLKADGENYGKAVELDEGNKWTHTWTGLAVNSSGKTIEYTVDEVSVLPGYDSTIEGFVITNSHTPAKITVSGAKTWDDADDQDGLRPESIQVNLLADGVKVQHQMVEADKNDNWTYSFANLDKFKDGVEIKYTVTEEAVAGYQTSIDGYNIKNTHVPEEIELTVNKFWDDANDQDGKRPENITVKLLADGEEIDNVLMSPDATDNWSHTFTGLAKYAAGEEITYTIEEGAVPGYQTEIDGFAITNTHTPEKTSVTVTKTWADGEDQDGLRPTSITVNLLADGVQVDSALISPNTAGDWEHTFADLDKFAAGKEIDYTITEEPIANYATSIDGYAITNVHTPETRDITITKTWDDANNQDGKRPTSITVRLLANGEEVANKKIEPDSTGNWQHTFTELAKFKAGQEITYTVTEDAVPGYTTEIDGFAITNRYTPETMTLAGQKIWDDADNQDGVRPTSITVNLLASVGDGQSQVVEPDEQGKWQYEFKDLPVYAEGKKITYTITEDSVPGYSTQISDNTITNKRTPDTTSATVTKLWNDEANQDGKRPDAVEVQLLANGEAKGQPIALNAGNNWTYTWTDLALKQAGKNITYTVEELDNIEPYVATLQLENHGNMVITNNYTPETMEISGQKVWVDGDDQDGIRPESITVILLADGKEVQRQPIEAGESDNWGFSFPAVPVFAEGKRIVYTVTEDPVASYDMSVDGYTITNTHLPETTTITGLKTWDDADNQDGLKPDYITVILLANNKEVQRQKVEPGEGDNWSYSFPEVPVFAEGERIVYTVTEEAVEGYSLTSDGYNLLNQRTPDTTNIAVRKVWDDGQNQDRLRPDSVTVQLYANGEAVGEPVDLEKSTDWAHTWTDLALNQAGELITYTVAELDAVEPYVSEVEQVDASNFVITNRHTPEVTSIALAKVWDDNDDQDGMRPTSITVHLHASVGESRSQIVEADETGNWHYEFSDLPVYADGEEIIYTLAEESVPGYTTEITGNEIVNSRTPDETSVTVTKQWRDDNNRDGVRPSRVEVQLLANGEATGDLIELNAANQWTYTWTGLPERANGKAITYSVAEVNLPTGYTVSVDDADHGNIVITNRKKADLITVRGEKIWQDNDDKAKRRPDSIVIELLQNGEKIKEQEVRADAGGNWYYVFDGLPRNEAHGKAYEYTIREQAVPGYRTTYAGLNVVNTLIPGRPDKPEVPDKPSKPDKPGVPEVPTDPADPDHPAKPTPVKPETQPGEGLPKTGELELGFNWLALMLLGLGLALFEGGRRGKRNRQEEE